MTYILNMGVAISCLVTALFLLFAVIAAARVEVSTTHILRGKLTCRDCDAAYDLSGIVVMAKCEMVRKVVTATTAKDGGFEMELPSDECEARLGGGRNQLYAAKKDMVAETVRAAGSSSGDGGSSSSDMHDTSTPLAFCSTCRCGEAIDSEGDEYCKTIATKFGSSKTFNLPLPPEWGLAPSSYYFPFFPIIGIP